MERTGLKLSSCLLTDSQKVQCSKPSQQDQRENKWGNSWDLQMDHGFTGRMGHTREVSQPLLSIPVYDTQRSRDHSYFTRYYRGKKKKKNQHIHSRNVSWTARLYSMLRKLWNPGLLCDPCPELRVKSLLPSFCCSETYGKLDFFCLPLLTSSLAWKQSFCASPLQGEVCRAGCLESTVVIYVSLSLPQSPHCAFKEDWGGRASRTPAGRSNEFP